MEDPKVLTVDMFVLMYIGLGSLLFKILVIAYYWPIRIENQTTRCCYLCWPAWWRGQCCCRRNRPAIHLSEELDEIEILRSTVHSMLLDNSIGLEMDDDVNAKLTEGEKVLVAGGCY